MCQSYGKPNIWTSWKTQCTYTCRYTGWHRLTNQPPLTHIVVLLVWSSLVTLLVPIHHTACANPSKNHSRALQASVAPLPRDWNCRSGRPRHTWLWTTEPDLAPLNTGLTTAYHRVQNWQAWSTLVGMATTIAGQATWSWHINLYKYLFNYGCTCVDAWDRSTEVKEIFFATV